MSQSLRELITKAEASGDWDEVADWCEAFDWSEAEEIPVAEFYLGCAAAVRPLNKHQLLEAVSAARANGTSWERIGEILGLSAQHAKEQYDPLLETQDSMAAPETKTALAEAEHNLEAGHLSTLD